MKIRRWIWRALQISTVVTAVPPTYSIYRRNLGILHRHRMLSLLLTPSGAETLVFWVSQLLACLVAPKDVPLMTRRGDLKLSHGATAKARETAVKQDRVQTTNAIKSP